MIHSFSDFFLLQDIAEGGTLFVASSEDTNLLLKRWVKTLPAISRGSGRLSSATFPPDGRSILFIDGAP